MVAVMGGCTVGHSISSISSLPPAHVLSFCPPSWVHSCTLGLPPTLAPSPQLRAGRLLRQVACGEWVVDDGISHKAALPFSLSLPRILPVTPVGSSLPGHRSTRPYTIFELEQVRQHGRKYGQQAEASESGGSSLGLGGAAGAAGGLLSSRRPLPSASTGGGRVRSCRQGPLAPWWESC